LKHPVAPIYHIKVQCTKPYQYQTCSGRSTCGLPDVCPTNAPTHLAGKILKEFPGRCAPGEFFLPQPKDITVDPSRGHFSSGPSTLNNHRVIPIAFSVNLK